MLSVCVRVCVCVLQFSVSTEFTTDSDRKAAALFVTRAQAAAANAARRGGDGKGDGGLIDSARAEALLRAQSARKIGKQVRQTLAAMSSVLMGSQAAELQTYR